MEKKYLSDTGLERLATYLQTDDVTIERAADGSLKLSTGQCVWYGHKATWDNLPASEQAKYGIVIFDDDGTTITIDSSLSTTSENAVQNKVITIALNGKQPKTLDTPITLGGTQYTTVEAFLGAVKNVVQSTCYWNGGN